MCFIGRNDIDKTRMTRMNESACWWISTVTLLYYVPLSVAEKYWWRWKFTWTHVIQYTHLAAQYQRCNSLSSPNIIPKYTDDTHDFNKKNNNSKNLEAVKYK